MPSDSDVDVDERRCKLTGLDLTFLLTLFEIYCKLTQIIALYKKVESFHIGGFDVVTK